MKMEAKKGGGGEGGREGGRGKSGGDVEVARSEGAWV